LTTADRPGSWRRYQPYVDVELPVGFKWLRLESECCTGCRTWAKRDWKPRRRGKNGTVWRAAPGCMVIVPINYDGSYPLKIFNGCGQCRAQGGEKTCSLHHPDAFNPMAATESTVGETTRDSIDGNTSANTSSADALGHDSTISTDRSVSNSNTTIDAFAPNVAAAPPARRTSVPIVQTISPTAADFSKPLTLSPISEEANVWDFAKHSAGLATPGPWLTTTATTIPNIDHVSGIGGRFTHGPAVPFYVVREQLDQLVTATYRAYEQDRTTGKHRRPYGRKHKDCDADHDLHPLPRQPRFVPPACYTSLSDCSNNLPASSPARVR
jgi:hypothetical protein